MNAKSFVVGGGALVLCLLGGVLATGCRPGETQQERPDAGTTGPDAGTTGPEAGTVLLQGYMRVPRPNLMLLVDTSGSMTNPVNPSLPACQSGGTVCGGGSTPCNTTTCPTRWSELQAAMQDFLSSSGSLVRLGLATYPSDDFCGPSTAISVPLPDAAKDDEATLAANAEWVKNKLLSIKNYSTTEPMPRGGTPTGLSLQFLGSRPELLASDREDFVLLVTDGLPNCNEAYPDPYPSSRCFCTLSDCSYVPKVGCLDKDASVMAVQALRSKDIKTIVMGFGSDFNSTSASGSKGMETLNAMAEKGGFVRACTQDSDCGTGDSCDEAAQRCNRLFYQAYNRSELASALQQIVERLPKASCLLQFDGAGSYTQESLVVSLDGQVLAPGESSWSLTSEGLLFTGTACQRLQDATPAQPVLVEVRVR